MRGGVRQVLSSTSIFFYVKVSFSMFGADSSSGGAGYCRISYDSVGSMLTGSCKLTSKPWYPDFSSLLIV